MSRFLPQQVIAIRDAYKQRFPVPAGGPNPADEPFENRCRAWIRGLAEQVRYSTGDPRWGCKNAGGGRPQSKDGLAEQLPEQEGRILYNYDMLFGVGTGSPSSVANPSALDITGQVFMPVNPVNHLGSVVPPQPPPSDDTDERQDAEITALQHHVAVLQAKVGVLEDQVARILGEAQANPLNGRKIALRASDGLVVCSDRNQHNHLISNRAYADDRIGAWEEFVIIDRGRG